MAEPTYYTCSNKNCTLGAKGEDATFSGGMSSQMKFMLTGTPEEHQEEGKDYGDGICPNCGEKGKKVTGVPKSSVAKEE